MGVLFPYIMESKQKNMVPNHQPVIKVEFPMIFHKTIGLPYDKPFGFWQNMPPSWTSSPHLWRACRVTCYRATIFCTATNSVTVYPGWWLSLPLWKMMDWKSVGMMTFPTEWKSKIHVPNHQPDDILGCCTHIDLWWLLEEFGCFFMFLRHNQINWDFGDAQFFKFQDVYLPE